MASGSFYKNLSSHTTPYRITVNWTSTPTTSSNSSKVTAKIVLYAPYALYIGARTGNTITINGTNYTYSSPAINTDSGGTYTLGTVTSNAITHNSNGSKSITITCKFKLNATISGTSYSTVTLTDTVALDTIPREASITAAPNFNDEANPTITYSNPAGNSVDSLQACISLTGAADDVAYRDISKTGTSYTFNLTTAERAVLRKAITSGNSRSVRFYVQTKIGDNTYRKYLTKTLTLVNYTPTLAPTVTDSNTTTSTLTGDSSKFIKYYSNAAITTGAKARKEATIKSQKVTCGSKSISAASGTISAVESGSFKFSVTDSRGNTTTQTVTKSLINYIKLTCTFSAKMTVDGVLTFTANGNYFNGSFGAASNTLTVQYRYKESGGSYSAWNAATAVKSGNTYSATGTISSLDYQKKYVIQVRAIDKLATKTASEKTITALPVFDWSASDFAFHTPVIMDNSKQLYFKSTDNTDVMMISLNNSNQSFFGYGSYNQSLGSTYFDGNSVYIRSKTAIQNTASTTIGGNKAWTNSSDSRLKKDIEDIPTVFADIWLELKPKMFEWNELNYSDEKKQFGLIAQEAIEVFEKYGVDYRELSFISIIPINGVDYFAITYEHYHMLTAQVLKNTVNELHSLKNEVEHIKELLNA